MSADERDLAVDLMLATLQIQQWLEEQKILDTNPVNDEENMRILIEVVENQAVARILESNEVVELEEDF